MSRGMYYRNCLRKYLTQWKYTDSQRLRACRMIHGTVPVPLHRSAINAGVTERDIGDQKPVRNIKDGPSLRNFLSPPVILDIPSEKPVPYIQDIRGENQKGFLFL